MVLSKPARGAGDWDVQVGALFDRVNEFDAVDPTTLATDAELAAHVAASAGARSLTDSRAGKPAYPTWTKYASNPVLDFDDQSLASLYWPNLIDVDGLVASPLGGHTWYLLYSTDHAGSGEDGIGLVTAASPYGPFTDRGLVFRDTAGGGQCETPWVMWDPTRSVFNMYYQLYGVGTGQQSTLLATTTDFQTFVEIGVVLDTPGDGTLVPGDGHTGYLRTYYEGDTIFGYHLLGGTATGGRVISYSLDGGRTFYTDYRRWRYTPWFGGADNYADIYDGCLFEWRGRTWWLGRSGSSDTGGLDPTDNRWLTAPVSDDLRSLAGVPVDVTPTAQAWENSTISGPIRVTPYDGTLLVTYRGGGDTGGIGVAVLEVP